MTMQNLRKIAEDIDSPTNRHFVREFLARRGEFRYNVAGAGTRFIPETRSKRPVIGVDPSHVAVMVRMWGGSELQAVRGILIHELGHFAYLMQNRVTEPTAGTALAARLDWCFKREAQAASYAYRVAKELRAKGHAAHVAGPSTVPDLFDTLAAAEGAGRNPLEAAKAKYSADPGYISYCRNDPGWSRLAPPAVPSSINGASRSPR